MEKLRSGIRRHPIYTLGGYFVLYMIAFSLLEAWNRPMHLVHCGLDDVMPFCKWAVLPYVAWFGWVPFVLFTFLYKNREAFWKLFGAMVSGITISLAAYVIYPTSLNLRHTITATDPVSRLLAFIYHTDTATNVCPSLHVFVTLLLFLALCNAPWVHTHVSVIVHGLIALSICASTVLIDQHSVIDVVLGAVLALGCYALFFFRAPRCVPAAGREPEPARTFAR